jgi:hypothetical protein
MSDKLTKVYPSRYSSLRRKWANLYRPMSSISILQPIVIIMFLMFLVSILLFMLGYENSGIPFITSWFFVFISFYYFSVWPLTWSEMNELEKKYYRELYRLPKDWNPKS